MEYSLYAIFYVIQSFFNLLFQFQVADGVTVGGIIIAIILIGCILMNIGISSSYRDAQEIFNRKMENMERQESDRRYREASRAYDQSRWSKRKKDFMNNYYQSRGWKR